jgi:hypothetical protein
MKTRLLLISAILFLLQANIYAKFVEIDDARKVAKNCYYEKMNQYHEGINYEDLLILYEYTEMQNSEEMYYAFDFDEGFVIVSAEDAYVPIIGYSYQGIYPTENLSYNFDSYMQSFIEQIQYIRANSISAVNEIKEQWDHLLTDDITTLNTNANKDVLTPLTSGMWNQDSPYNILCPEDDGPGGHVYAGCVATCMSMIMYYWRYPIHGEGEHSYWPSPEYGQLYVNFGETYYQWDGMKDNIDNINPYPIAELMYHCGVAVNMSYGPDGSGAFSGNVPGKLDSYFRYNTAEFCEKADYTQIDWQNLVKSDLDNGWPLYYSGQSTSGGHAFVCDAYQGNNFHFNFGWSGYGNGFFSLYSVGGFNMDQAVVREFIPSDPDYPYYPSGLDTITQISGSFTDDSGPIEDYLDNTDASWLIDPQTQQDSITNIILGFKHFDLEENDYLRVYDGETIEADLIGEFTGDNIPAGMSSTGNKMLITFESDGSGTASGFRAEFSTTRPTYCSGLVTITEPSGELTDGSGTFNYKNGSVCKWRIQPPDAEEATITFTSFNTIEDEDIVKIYNTETSELLATYSGNYTTTMPDPVTSPSGKLYILFTTSSFTNDEGWEAVYSTPLENQTINVNPGFQFVSSCFEPANPDMLEVVQEIISDDLLYVRNSEGAMLRKIGPNWVNGIGDWIGTEGYLIKTNAAGQFTVDGTLIPQATPIELIAGFQFVSFLPGDEMDAIQAFSSIISDDLLYVRNSEGAMLRKIGPNWVNGIGNCIPTEGYLIKLAADATLIYPNLKSSESITKILHEHFVFEGGNAADPVYTIYVEGLNIGDEIAAFDGETMLGATRINSQNTFNNELAVFNTTYKGQGYQAGNSIVLKVWDFSTQTIDQVDFTMLDPYNEAYNKTVYPGEDGLYSVVNITKSSSEADFEETTSIFPNPATDKITIQSSSVINKIVIINCVGQVMYEESHNSNLINIKTENYNPGIYIIQIGNNNEIINKKIMIE